MTTEELKLKVSIDTSGLQQDVAKVKTSLKGAEDSLSGKGIQNGAKITSESLAQVRSELDAIRNLQFADMILENFDSIKKGAQVFVSSFKLAGEEIAGIFSKEHFSNTDTLGEAFSSMGIQAKESLKSIQFGFKELGKSISGVIKMLLPLLAIVAEIAVVVATVKTTIAQAKEIAQLSREAFKVGMDTQSYAEWGFVLKQNGIEVDKLSDFLKTLAAEQNSVREGAEDTIAAFKKLGLSANEVANMSQQELFEKTVIGLQKIENQVERTGIAYKIFGEDDAANIIPILSMTNEQLDTMRRNYEILGGNASPTLIARSQELQSSLNYMSLAWTGAKNAIAEGFLPAVITVVNWLTKAIAVIGMFFRALFGTSSKDSKTTDTVNNMTSGTNSYTNAVNGATKAVQQLKREQMGFDELNVLPGKDSSSGSGSGGGIGASGISGGGMNIPEMDGLIDFQEKLQGIQDWFDKYRSLIQMITPIAITALGIFIAVAGFMSGNILMGIAGIGLAGLGIGLGVANGGWEQIGQTLKTGLNDLKMSAIVWFKNMEVRIKDWWNGVKESCSEGIQKAKDKLTEKFKPIKDWFNTNVKPVFTKAYWQEKFDTIKAGAQEKLEAAKTAINEKWTTIKTWFNKNVADKFTKKYWQTKFDGVRAGISDKMSAAKTTITDAWSSIKTWFSKNVASKFTKSHWQTKFETIKSGAKAAFNGIISIVETAINRIINKINTLSWKIPDWVPSVGGSKFGFNFKTVSIPRLATGGIATRSTLANIGEAGAEAVLPLENNTQWMDKLADKIASRSGGPSKLVLNVDGKTLGWVAIDNINQITKQTGEIPLAI